MALRTNRTKEEILAEVHEEAIRRFDVAYESQKYERESALGDRRFANIPGATWEGAVGDNFGNRPKLELSVIPREKRRLLGEWRDNRITVDYVSKTGDAADEMADVCDGLYRADEIDSGAMEAFDVAFDEGVTGGMGAWRLSNEYEDELDDEDDRQRIRFEPIYEADSLVFFDPSAKRADKADAGYCFVLQSMSLEEYETEYGDSVDEWPRGITDSQFDWATDASVYVAEYYRVEIERYTVLIFEDITGNRERFNEDDLDDAAIAEMEAIGTRLVMEKRVKRRRVRKFILSGGLVLEDGGYIAGPNIPVVPYYAERAVVDGVERFWGLVRFVKDAVRLKNLTVSALAYMSAQSGADKPIVTPGQMAGNEAFWKNDATENYAALPLSIDYDKNDTPIVGPIGAKAATQIPPTMAALISQAGADIVDILGNQTAGDKLEANLSGKAIELVQTRLDALSMIYMSNFAKAVQRCGEIWLGMAREIYVEPGRVMKLIGTQDETSSVKLMDPIHENGETSYRNDLSKAKFDVVSDVGPASSSRRSATVRALSSMLPLMSDQQDQKVVAATILRNMEGEGISSVREYFRRQLVRFGVEDPTDEDLELMAQELAQQAPNPQAILAAAMAKEAEARAAKAQAETFETVADTEHTRAKTAETLAGIDRDDRQAAVDAATKIGKAIQGPAMPAETRGTAAPQIIRETEQQQ